MVLTYRFQVRYCNPESGWEKGNVENKVGTIRETSLCQRHNYHDMVEYNKTLLPMNEHEAAKPHYKRLQLIKDLFKEDQKQFLSLPSMPFDVCRYDWFKADGYGKVCIDGKHYYSTKPELHNQKVLIGIRAHYIDVLEENGQLIVRHRRQYGDVRTDVSDYSTTLSVLSRNAGARNNSGIRKELPDPLRDYLDGLEKPELKEKLRLMSGA